MATEKKGKNSEAEDDVVGVTPPDMALLHLSWRYSKNGVTPHYLSFTSGIQASSTEHFIHFIYKYFKHIIFSGKVSRHQIYT